MNVRMKTQIENIHTDELFSRIKSTRLVKVLDVVAEPLIESVAEDYN